MSRPTISISRSLVPRPFHARLIPQPIRTPWTPKPIPFHHAQTIRSNSTSRSSHSSSSSSSSSFTSNLLRPTTLVLIFVPILTGFLGVWQIKRLRWKVALIEEVDRNLMREPMVLPGVINLSALPEFSFRRVLLRGHFASPPILLGPQVKDGVPGYNLILPFIRSTSVPGSTTILVNRGFITTTRANAIRSGKEVPPGLKTDGSPGDEVIVEGVLTRDEGRSWWAPENNLEGNEWFWKDRIGMAEFCGGEEKGVQPVLVDAIDYGEVASTILMQQGVPVGRPPHIELRNQHATYAATWLSLSAATSVMLVLLLRRGAPVRSAKKTFGEALR